LEDALNIYNERKNQEALGQEKWKLIEDKNRLEFEASLKMAQDLQDEEDKNREERRKQKEDENAPDCPICLEKILGNELLPLDRCGHIFHPACVRSYFKAEIDARKFPLVCPNGECKLEVTPLDVKDFLDFDSRQKFEEYTFKKTVEENPADFSFCPSPDCKYVFVWEAGKDSNNFLCPMCGKNYCLDCRCDYHTGQTCKEYKISTSFSVILYGIIKPLERR